MDGTYITNPAPLWQMESRCNTLCAWVKKKTLLRIWKANFPAMPYCLYQTRATRVKREYSDPHTGRLRAHVYGHIPFLALKKKNI